MVTAAASGTSSDRDGLVGRERELRELCCLTESSRLVTLCGAGGIGKTRLLNALAAALAPGYPDGTVVTRLADLAQPDLLGPRVAATLGVCEEPGAELADTLAQALCGRRLVLALDGYEQLASACAVLCQRLLESLPGLLVITAGRAPLRLPGEVSWPVPALALPAAGDDDPELAARAGAVRLFIRRAAAAAPGFALDAGNCRAVVAACRAAGGVPLAIELAAARVRDLDAGQVAAGLSARLAPPGPAGPSGADGRPSADRQPVPGRQPVPAPQAAMSAAIGWSHDQLAPAEQVLLRRLSASPSWTLEMAELTCAGDDLPAAGCLSLLTRLAGLALIEPGRGRWRVPRAIGDDAAARLSAAGETERAGRRPWDYAAQRAEYLVSIAHATVPVTTSVLDRLFRDYNTDARNVRAALAWCLDHGDAAAGLRICTQFGIYWIAAGAPGEGAWWFGAFGAFLDGGGPAVPAAVRGPALAVRGQLAYHRGDLAGAQAWASAGLELCQAASDLHYAAIALNVLGETATAAGRPADALRHTDEALELARLIWDSWNRVLALNVRSEALTALGRLTEARESAAAALAVAVEIDHHWGAADARRRLAEAALAAGDLDAARDSYLAALPYLRASMPRPDAARCLADLGRIALRQGDPGQGREYLAQALQLSLSAGSRAGIAVSLLAFAELADATCAPDRAVRLAAAATALRAAAGLPPPARAQPYRDRAAGHLWDDGLRLTAGAAARLALAPPER